MKRGIGVILCTVLALSLVGCGKKKPVLSCSNTMDPVTLTYDIEYNKEKTEIKKFVFHYQLDFKNSEANVTDELINKTVDGLCKKYEDDTTSCDKKIKNKVLTVSMDYDLDKLDQDTPFKRTMKMEEMKQMLETDHGGAYTCKETTK